MVSPCFRLHESPPVRQQIIVSRSFGQRLKEGANKFLMARSSYSSGSASQRDIMSHQLTFPDSRFSTKRRQQTKEIFLSLHGADSAMAEYDRCHRAVLSSKAGNGRRPIRWRPCCVFTACSIGTTERRCHGRCPVRNSLHAPVCPIIPGYAPAGSHLHHHEFRPLEAASTGLGQLFGPSIAGWRSRRHDDQGTFSAMPPSLRRQLYQEQRAATPIRRCIRPRKAISGTLA